MSYTTEILPRESWSALASTELERVWQDLPPDSKVIVVKDDGEIQAHWVLMPIWHAEFLSIAPKHQGKTALARRLYAAMRRLLKDAGIRAVYTGAVDEHVVKLLDHVHAQKLPGEHYIWVQEN